MTLPRTLLAALLLCTSAAIAQDATPKLAAPTPIPKTPYYIDLTILHPERLLPDPPAPDSAAAKADNAELHLIEAARTPEQVAKFKADEAEEDIFVYKTVLGPGFNAAALPLTAALGDHVKNEQSVVGGQLKKYFDRPRPYQVDSTLHPVCALKQTHDSYPSGHALTGFLEGLTLAELLPEKRTEILARADDYAHSRLGCGVHYPSDIEASRRVAYVTFGVMLATPKFQQDLAQARTELHTKLVPAK